MNCLCVCAALSTRRPGYPNPAPLPRPGPSPSPPGILSCISGSLLRITLEQVLPKDGSLVAPLSPYALQ